MSTDVAGADAVVRGRIATLAGDAGFGWVEAIAIAGGRVVGAGSAADVEPLVGPATRRLDLAPDEVAIPALTDAHQHLAEAALAAGQLDLAGAANLAEGLAMIALAHAATADPEAWLEGRGWEADRWGGWPTAADLERVAPGRRIGLWAHDHHAMWASPRALREAGIDAERTDPPGGRIRRDERAGPAGVLHETAAGLVASRIPLATTGHLADAIVAFAPRLVALGVVAVHDPGRTVFDPEATSLGTFAALSDAGRLAVRVHAGLRPEALPGVVASGRRSGDPLGDDPAGRARLGWQKLFADGTLGSRTAALLAPFEAEPGQPALPAGAERGIFVTPPAELTRHAADAAAVGIATEIHAIGDAAVRAALDALEPHARRGLPMPRLEHVQLLDPTDRGRFAAGGIAASVQPVHLRSDAAQARALWGERAESIGYPLASLAATGAVLAFGTDAPVEPIDPWPGIAMAVSRASGSWPAGTLAFGPSEALSLDRALRAACVDPAVTAGETDRGRLTAGHRADVVVLPAAALAEPIEPGGPLERARPRLVLIDGDIAFEA